MMHFIEKYRIESVVFMENLGIDNGWAVTLQSAFTFLAMCIFGWMVDRLATQIMRKYIPKIVGRTATDWDDIFVKNKVFANMAHFFPGVVMLLFGELIASDGCDG
ncbi:hypothetical protein QIU18_09360 [Capnocytophaga canimorsus]|nr:hypothetical protein [Capnocytophaga canimorsus]WGU69805.1 hypothetical protein QIU18_09360 [Capnocytophaga canimorsus]